MSQSPTTLIGRGTRIEGNVRFSGALRVEGTVHGEVRGEGRSAATLDLGPQGNIVGSVAGVDLRSEGRIDGVVTDAGVVELRADSQTSGELSYAVIDVQHGAVVDCLLKPARGAGEPSGRD
ncbi:MAG TPA: polymer-forming cytoskeletal protein [Burkholderiales bacterium]|nr:polymer-forming cytoskeletal protein [Burkholderiales bacterium]